MISDETVVLQELSLTLHTLRVETKPLLSLFLARIHQRAVKAVVASK